MYVNSLLLLATFIITTNSAVIFNNDTRKSQDPDLCKLVVIAHRGASGYVPEHTLGAYALAVTLGADYIEPDLVMTMDGHLIVRHENELSTTTNVAQHLEFAGRHRMQTIDGQNRTGWFTEDFTLAEIKTLRIKERIPDVRPGNARMDGTYTIPTLQETIDLIKGLQLSQNRIIGIYPEIKHSTHFKRLGLSIERVLIELLQKNGYSKSTDPVYIQSFEVTNLKELRNHTELRLVQLYAGKKSKQPIDQVLLSTGLTYDAMATAEGLQEVAKYATAVGPHKSYIIPRDEDNRLDIATSFVSDAHAAGLKVHPYSFRAENFYLPEEYQGDDRSPTAPGDLNGEIMKYLATGIDGLFTEHPDVTTRARGLC